MASAGLGSAFRQLRSLFGGGSVVALEDGQLLARYATDGDQAAFEALIGRHGPMVLTVCRAVLRNEHDVEDAFQATFLVLARRAGSIRGGDALGGWLHRVAYRASVQTSTDAARRRRKEAEARAMAERNSPKPQPDGELQALLHQEINRLPESQRLAVVLCDLEALTYDEAARRLQWTVPTLRNRLARGRQSLKTRLTRRGLTPPAIAALASPKTLALVPPALARVTLQAATGGATSAASAWLAQSLLKGMLMTQIKTASIGTLTALAVVALGVMAAGSRENPDEPKPVIKPPPRTLTLQEKPASKKPQEIFVVEGRVLDPKGKPVAGSSVRVAMLEEKIGPATETTSDSNGRFTIQFPKLAGNPLTRDPWLIARSPKFGPGWASDLLRTNRPAELVVTLAEEGPPIEGHLVDLEGRPIASAQVQVDSIFFDADMTSWIAQARNSTLRNLPEIDHFPVGPLSSMTATTDKEGRFRLTGIGRDQIASLQIKGAGIATTQAFVFCREEPEVVLANPLAQVPSKMIIHAPRFQLVLPPSKPVVGVARDLDSGRPIAGLAIKAGLFEEYSREPIPGIEARTDSEGRYRIEGLPKAESYRLFVAPRPDLPYPEGSFRVVAGSPGLEPVAFDFALKRGVVIRGRVTDKVTGEPASGNVFFMASSGNPHVAEFPGFSGGDPLQFSSIKPDGSYEILALPGRGLLAVKNFESRFRAATGLEAVHGYDPGMNGFLTALGPIPASGYNLFVETDLDPKAESATIPLQLDPGRSLTLKVIAPDGSPLGGTKVEGLGELSGPRASEQEDSSFPVHALDPTHPRRLILRHDRLKLAASLILEGDEASPVTIRLEPWGTIVGRIVDDQGQPQGKGFELMNDRINRRGAKSGEIDDRGVIPEKGTYVTIDGRFRVEGLVPGLKYGSLASKEGMITGHLFRDVTIAPGEVKDLGDLKIVPD